MSPTRQQTLDRFDGDEEAMSAHFRDMQAKSRKNYKGTGGFNYLKRTNPDKLKAIQSKGGKGNKNASKKIQGSEG